MYFLYATTMNVSPGGAAFLNYCTPKCAMMLKCNTHSGAVVQNCYNPGSYLFRNCSTPKRAIVTDLLCLGQIYKHCSSISIRSFCVRCIAKCNCGFCLFKEHGRIGAA